MQEICHYLKHKCRVRTRPPARNINASGSCIHIQIPQTHGVYTRGLKIQRVVLSRRQIYDKGIYLDHGNIFPGFIIDGYALLHTRMVLYNFFATVFQWQDATVQALLDGSLETFGSGREAASRSATPLKASVDSLLFRQRL